MDVSERRTELLQVGCELFATRPYDEVWIDDVAKRAGVSRSLLYHYFESKRGFLHAIVEHETTTLREATQPDSDLPPFEQLSASLDSYLRYVQEHPYGYRALFQGAPATDSEVREMIDRNLRLQEERILAALSAGQPPSEQVRMAVHGWLGFVVSVALEWIARPRLTVSEVRVLCVDTLVAALASTDTQG